MTHRIPFPPKDVHPESHVPQSSEDCATIPAVAKQSMHMICPAAAD